MLFFSFLTAAALGEDSAIDKSRKVRIEPARTTLQVGEKLQYNVEWLGIYVGKIIIKVEGIEEINAKQCYHISGIARPNRVLSKFYNVEYFVHTYIDTETNYPVRFKKIRRMNNESQIVEIEFDRDKKQVKYTEIGSAPALELSGNRPKTAAGVSSTLKILNGTQDLFSSLYYLRLLNNVEENHSYAIEIYYNKANWPLKAKIGEPFTKDIRKKGTFTVFEINLESELGSLILGRSKMSVLLTADARRIPVQFRFSTGAGPIRGVIENISY